MPKRDPQNRTGRLGNVKRKTMSPKKPGRLASRRKRWVSRIWLDTVLAGEREIHQGNVEKV